MSRKLENNILGHAHIPTLVVLEHLFKELKQVIPHEEKIEIEIHSLIMTNYSGLNAPHFDDYRYEKEKED